MGKHERASSLVHASSSSIPPDERYRRRMWGLFHILNYHQWRSIKRRLQSKKHGSDKHSTGKVDPGSGSVAGLSEKQTRFAEDGEESSPNHSTKREPGRAGSKNSMRLRIRSLIPDDKFRHKGRHHRTSTAPGPLQSIRSNTDSSLEPTIDVSPTTLLKHSSSEHSALNEAEARSTNKTPPDGRIDQHKVETPEKRQISSGRNREENPEQHVDLQSPDYNSMNSINNLDVVEGINKELLLKFIRDAGAFSAQQRKEHKQKGIFQRSGTFPLPGLHTGNVGEENLPSHEEKARPPGPEERNSHDGDQATSLAETEASGDVHREIDPIVEADVPQCNTNRTAYAPVVGNGRNHGKNQAVSKHLKAFKRKIQHAMKVNRKEKNHIAMDGILHRVPGDKEFSGELMEEMIRKWKEATIGRSDPTGQDNDKHSSSLGQRGVARTPSLEASLHKYAQLFESSFGAEAKCQGSSMVPTSCPHNVKKLGRIASSPDIKFYSPDVDVDPETPFVKKAVEVSAVVDDATVKEECSSPIPDVSPESRPLVPASQETALDECGDAATLPKTLSMKKTVEVTKVDDNVTVEEECSSLVPDAGTESQPFVPASQEMVLDELGNVVTHPMETNDEVQVSTSKENLDENESSGALENELFELPAARDELSLEHEHSRGSSLFDILQDDTEEIFTDLQYLEEQKTMGIDAKRDYIEEREISSKALEDFIDAQIHLKDRDFFNYVRDVLEISGLSGKGSLGSLHPNNQPLDRAIYDEVEDIWTHEPGSSKNYEGTGNYDHVLLFDLINEVLFEIYERSFTYYPKTLSTLCRIHRMPGGHRVLEEVWTTISHHMSIEASLDQTMDYVTCKDLEKQDNWMNLQCDSEGVGIELEDMILDDLLDEMIFE